MQSKYIIINNKGWQNDQQWKMTQHLTARGVGGGFHVEMMPEL